MKDMLKKGALFGLLFTIVFIVGLRLTFPMKLVTSVIESQAEAALDFKYDIEIERTRFSGISGVKLIGVSIESTAPLEEGEIRIPMRFDSARVRLGLLSAVRGNPRVRADLRLDDGEIRADFGPNEDGRGLKIELFDVELRGIAPVQAAVGLPTQGAASGTVQITWTDEWRITGGDVELGIAGLVFGPGNLEADAFAQFGGFIPLPATDLGNVVIRAPMEGSDVRIEQFEASGTDVRLNASGEVQIRTPRATSRLNLNLDFQLDGGYVEEAGLGAVLGDASMQRLQVGDGFALSISGPLARPSVGPASRGGRR